MTRCRLAPLVVAAGVVLIGSSSGSSTALAGSARSLPADASGTIVYRCGPFAANLCSVRPDDANLDLDARGRDELLVIARSGGTPRLLVTGGREPTWGACTTRCSKLS